MRKNIQKEIPNIIKKNAFPNRDVSVKLLILLEEKAMEVQKLIRKDWKILKMIKNSSTNPNNATFKKKSCFW